MSEKEITERLLILLKPYIPAQQSECLVVRLLDLIDEVSGEERELGYDVGYCDGFTDGMERNELEHEDDEYDCEPNFYDEDD